MASDDQIYDKTQSWIKYHRNSYYTNSAKHSALIVKPITSRLRKISTALKNRDEKSFDLM